MAKSSPCSAWSLGIPVSSAGGAAGAGPWTQHPNPCSSCSDQSWLLAAPQPPCSALWYLHEGVEAGVPQALPVSRRLEVQFIGASLSLSRGQEGQTAPVCIRSPERIRKQNVAGHRSHHGRCRQPSPLPAATPTSVPAPSTVLPAPPAVPGAERGRQRAALWLCSARGW